MRSLNSLTGTPPRLNRWLTALSLQGIGGETVIATLRAFIEQAPTAVTEEETERVLGKMIES